MPEIKDSAFAEAMRKSGYRPLSEDLAERQAEALDPRHQQLPYCATCGQYEGSPAHACGSH